jgi:hypothetical protein
MWLGRKRCAVARKSSAGQHFLARYAEVGSLHSIPEASVDIITFLAAPDTGMMGAQLERKSVDRWTKVQDILDW